MSIQVLKCRFIIFLTLIMGLTACGGGGGGGGGFQPPTPPRNDDVTLQSIQLTPGSQSLPKGVTQQYVATGTYSDKSTKDLSSEVNWTSSNASLATISTTGLVSTLAAGSVAITAKLGTVSSTPASLTITAPTLASIEVTGNSVSLAKGISQNYSATGVNTDGSTVALTSQVVWESSNPSIASVDADGIATANNVGSVSITAKLGTIIGSANLVVNNATLKSIEVSAAYLSLAAGVPQQFFATATFSDNTTAPLTEGLTWTSNAMGIATVDSAGYVTTLAPGSTQISATFNPGTGAIVGSNTLVVTAATLQSIELTASSATLSKGTQQSYIATGIYSDGRSADLTQSVTWTSSSSGVAAISDTAGVSKGVATALALGTTTISATLNPGTGAIAGLATLTVNAAALESIEVHTGTEDNDTLFVNLSQAYTATGVYTDGSTVDITQSVLWSVTPDAITGAKVASISNDAGISSTTGSQGLLTALAAGGPVDVRATLNGVTGSLSLTVASETLLSIDVTPANQTLPKGLSSQYTAIGTYSGDIVLDLTSQPLLAWSSSDPSKASISNAKGAKGVATALDAGPTTISASLGIVSGSASLTVSTATLSSIALSPATLSLPKRLTQQYTATGTFSDASTQDITRQVTWASSAPMVASISNASKSRGLASTLSAGNTTITAILPAVAGVTGSASLTVTDQVLSSLTVAPAATSCGRNKKKAFTATAMYADGAMQALTMQVNWSSSNTKLVTIGLHTGVAKTTQNPNRVGTATVFAKLGGKTGSATVTKDATKSACTP